MSGENYRVVYGAGETIRYRLVNSEKEARSIAAAAIHHGTVSEVAVEENRNGKWAPALANNKYGYKSARVPMLPPRRVPS